MKGRNSVGGKEYLSKVK